MQSSERHHRKQAPLQAHSVVETHLHLWVEIAVHHRPPGRWHWVLTLDSAAVGAVCTTMQSNVRLYVG